MLNITCGVSAENHSDFYVLYHACDLGKTGANYPSTTVLFAVLGAVSMILAIVTYFCYNRVSVLQYRIFNTAISNSLWVAYLVVIGTRSIVLSIAYARNFNTERYFFTNWILGSCEMVVLCFALNYQRRFRFSENIAVDPEDETNELKRFVQSFRHMEWVIILEFVLVIISILLFLFVQSTPGTWFWIYVAFSLVLVLTGLFISLMIALNKGFDKPALITKIYFVISVLFCIPERVPMFVWKNCAGVNNKCWLQHFDLLDLFVLFKIIAVLFIFRALWKEYNRLKNECQFALLREVPNYAYQ